MTLRTVGSLTIASSEQLYSGGGQIRRIAAAEATGSSTASIHIWDGMAPGGQLLDSIPLNANSTVHNGYGEDEYPFSAGLYLELVSGKVDFVVTFDDGR